MCIPLPGGGESVTAVVPGRSVCLLSKRLDTPCLLYSYLWCDGAKWPMNYPLFRICAICLPVAVLTIPLLTSPPVFAQINKCVVNGKTVYTDQPCPLDTQQKLTVPPINTLNTDVRERTETQTQVKKSGYRSSRWYEDFAGYQHALRVSRAQNASIFIYAYTDWCGYCRKFESALLPNSSVQSALSNLVKVRINPEHSAKDEELFKKWGGIGYPSLYVQRSARTVPNKLRGPFFSREGQGQLIAADEFVRAVNNPFGIEVREVGK